MKSKIAEEYILSCEQDSKILYRDEVFTAIDISEQYAREIAIKSFCEFNQKYCDGEHGCIKESCSELKEFSRIYDNY